MVSGRAAVQFVVASSVRSDIVDVLREGPSSTEEVIATLDASTSAIYTSLGELEERGLVRSPEDGPWELTGGGRLVADMVRQRERCERVFSVADEYFRTHETAPLPRPFRLRVGELAETESDVDVIRASETKPHRPVEEITQRIEQTADAMVVSPIYVESYAEAMPDTSDSKLLLDEQVVRWARNTEGVPTSEFDQLSLRVADVEFALSVTESELLLSLPTLEGEYDPQSELVAEHDRARNWGEDLFEWHWERATPIEQFGAGLQA